MHQSVCRLLGVLDYSSYPSGLLPSIHFLLGSVDRTVRVSAPSMFFLDLFWQASTALQNVEARRNAYISLPQILSSVLPHLEERESQHTNLNMLSLTKSDRNAVLSPELIRAMYDCFLAGLEDYSVDERGDVGSWIRVACVKGITDFSVTFLTNIATAPKLADYLPSDKFHEGAAGILKQGVERLDNVRQQAGEQMLRLLAASSEAPQRWRVHGEELMRELFLRYAGSHSSYNK